MDRFRSRGRAARGRSRRLWWPLSVVAAVVLATGSAAAGSTSGGHHGLHQVRFATFNASLNRAAAGELISDLEGGGDPQAAVIAETIQRVRPDVVLLNEFDHDADGRAAELFQNAYLSVGRNGAEPIRYPYRYTAPVNTGVASGFDLNNDGRVVTEPGAEGYGDDAFGFGEFPGQYGMVVYSRYPIDQSRVRTFRYFRWRDMPGAELPVHPETGEPWYSEAELEELRLSSKSHWDLPILVGRRPVHFLVSHPTPPTFDGDEDRNGLRNHDEIRFWADYIRGGSRSRYIYDDRGRRGGLRPGSDFVVAGDLNADPYDGDSHDKAVRQLLEHPLVDDRFVPASPGALEAARVQGGHNAGHRGHPAHDTADFADAPPEGPGNLRVDHVLPSWGQLVVGGGVFWPRSDDPLSRLTGEYPFPGSDHRMVWLDLIR